MNPDELFCLNLECPAKGQVGQGNISVHSQKEERCRCNVCGDTFGVRKGTLFYRLRTNPEMVILVLTLLAYGCPTQAAAKAFGFDERTIRKWWVRAGRHCESFHKYMVEEKQMDLEHVQADEIKVKVQGGSLWMALAIMVSTRLWLSGEVSAKRDKRLIQRLADKIKGMALCRPLLLAVDGLASYPGAFRRAFRSKMPRFGQLGRPQFVSWPDIAIVQVVKQRACADWRVDRRIWQGSQQMVDQLRLRTQGRLGTINTAYIERLNATFRQRLHWLSRRSRSLAQQPQTLIAGMYIVGCFYNFCDFHKSLRLRLSVGERSFRWVHRTPAIAAHLTDHQWSAHELFCFRVPPPRWLPPTSRGRPSLRMKQLIEHWA